MADVFISYASPDRGRAEKLAHALSKRGISVWWDRELAAGDDFEAVIDRELAAARLVIVVWSQHAVVSPWVRSEAAEGLKQNKLLPVRLDDARIPRPFDQLHTTRIRTGPATEGFASLIVTRLRDTVSKRPQKKSESQPAAWVPAFVAVFVAVVGTVLILSRSFFPSTGLEGSTSIASEAGAQDRVTRAVGVTARPGATSLDQRALRVLLENLNTSDRPADAAVFALLETGNVASAIDQLEASYEVMREHSSPDERVDLLHQLAGLSFYSDVPRSKAFYEEILDITPNDFHATRRLATIAYWQSESAIADRYFVQASEIGAPTLEDELDLDIRHGMAMLQEYRFDEALDKLEAAAAVAEQSGHDELSSLAWTRIAHGHYLAGRPELSAEIYEDIMPWQEEQEYLADLASGHCTLGRIYREADRLDEAWDAFTACLEIEEAIDRVLGVTYTIQNLAAVELELGNLDRAEALFSRGLKLARLHELGNSEIKCQVGLAWVNARRGHRDDACRIIQRLEDSYGPSTTASAYSQAVRESLEDIGCGFVPLGIVASAEGVVPR